MGIRMAVNHASHTQLTGWIDLIDELHDLFNDSEFHESEADELDFWNAVTGMHSDHAEDQKKLFRLLKEWKAMQERELRGERALLRLSSSEFLEFITKVMLHTSSEHRNLWG